MVNPMVRSGLDLWTNDPSDELRALRLGLVSHPAAVLPDLTGAVDALRAAGYHLTALFGPEHGFSGSAADGAVVNDALDARTGLPIYSLYGAQKEPSEQALEQVDALVFDMQDVGARFYTYLSTLFHVLRVAGRTGKAVYVLDRPNPVTGTILEGGAVEPGCESFVGVVNIPIRHGMTLGELALYLNAEYALGAEVCVVKMQNWRRAMWFDETGLPWVPTSPAMPHALTATLYPGMCLLEGTNFSLGRGTATPFELCGAPNLDGYGLAAHMNALQLPGVRFRPLLFMPTASNYARQECRGVQVHVTDRQVFRPVAMSLALIAVLREMSPRHFRWNAHFERLVGGSGARASLEAEQPVSVITDSWSGFLSDFIQKREQYLLYA
jgi:uncharacterized protein YbbC (DUF1343 family)